jgi:hypothetical protein
MAIAVVKCQDCIARKAIIHAFDASCTTFCATAVTRGVEVANLAEHVIALRENASELSRDTPNLGEIPVSSKLFRRLLYPTKSTATCALASEQACYTTDLKMPQN